MFLAVCQVHCRVCVVCYYDVFAPTENYNFRLSFDTSAYVFSLFSVRNFDGMIRVVLNSLTDFQHPCHIGVWLC